MKRALLVDFDGVIMRNKSCHKIVEKRIIKYVANVFKIKDYDKAKQLNTFMYKTYGHTYWGMKQLQPHIPSLSDFNHFVYSDLGNEIKSTINKEEYLDDINQWYNFYKIVNDTIPVQIFSSAPSNWCNIYLEDFSSPHLHNFSYISDNLPNNAELLKPRKHIYKYIQETLLPNHQIFFIDDSVINFTHPIKYENWVNILFKPESTLYKDTVSDRMFIAGDFNDCVDIINHTLYNNK